MKSLICAVVVAATVLSMTTAAVLPHHRDYLKDIFALQRTKGAVPQSEEYTRYMDLVNVGWYGEFKAFSFANFELYRLIAATEGFNPDVKDQIFQEYENAYTTVFDILLQIAYVDSEDTPMPNVALLFNERFAIAKEALTTSEQNIQSLVKAESPELSLRVNLLIAGANAATIAAWTPVVAYLHRFLPSQ